MAFFSGDTALEASMQHALARADLNDPQSFIECVNIVKTYTKAKMVKYKSLAPALPGGKLEALEKKYAHLGFQDIFYVTRLELKLPASSVPLPRPTPPVLRRLEAAGYPLPTTFFGGPSSSSPDSYDPPSPTIARSISGRSRKSSWISEDEFRAGMPLTRETYGFANRVRKAEKEVEGILAAAAAANANYAAMSPPSSTQLSPARPSSIPPVPPLPPLPPPPKRAPANPIYLDRGFSNDLKPPPPCGCLDHPNSPSPSHKSALSFDSKYSYVSKLSGDTKEAIRPDSPTIPVSPGISLKSISEEPSGASNRDTVDIRALFDALPPEAKAMAVERLEAKRRAEEQERATLAAEKEARERARVASWERAKARERLHKAQRHSRLELESHVEALERQKAQLLATQHLTAEPEGLPGLQGLVDALPTPPPRVDEDARRMIEARIAALQSALNAMGVEPGSPPLPATPMSAASTSRSPLTPPMRFSNSTISTNITSSPLPSPIITPHSPFAARYSKPAQPLHGFDLDEHIDALCRAAEAAEHTQREESRAAQQSRPVVPLTPAGIAAQLGENRRSPPPSYTLVEAGRSFSVETQTHRR